eukprot:11200590-Lingulodinium_polyedra.AAC.1
MRSSRPSIAVAGRKSHARVLPRAPAKWRARGARERAICEPLQQRAADSTVSLCSVLKTLRSDVVE